MHTGATLWLGLVVAAAQHVREDLCDKLRWKANQERLPDRLCADSIHLAADLHIDGTYQRLTMVATVGFTVGSKSANI